MHDAHQLLSWVPRLRQYARALAGNRDDADDLVQDTLERAWAKSGLWRAVTDMRAWLFSIMHNLHVDGVRRPRLQTVPMDDENSELPVAPNQGERFAVLDLQTALDQLPVEQKEILLLCCAREHGLRRRGDDAGHPDRLLHVEAVARACAPVCTDGRPR